MSVYSLMDRWDPAHMHTCTHAHMHTCTHAHMHALLQTGSGKTFTMEGGENVEADEEEAGMIPRTIRQIFEAQVRPTSRHLY